MKKSDIDKGDWRLQTTTHLAEEWKSPWTGQVSPVGTRLTVVSVIQLTNKKLLTVPLPNATAAMLNAAANAYNNAKDIRAGSEIDNSLKKDVSFKSEKDAIDYIERMIESILLSFSAIEAFANETIPADFVYVGNRKSKLILDTSNKNTIERHFSIEEKLNLVIPEVLICSSPKGSHCWENYKKLKSARDRIIHMKTDDRKSSGPELETVWKVIITIPAPHLIAKELIDFFVKKMENKPQWHSRFLNLGN